MRIFSIAFLALIGLSGTAFALTVKDEPLRIAVTHPFYAEWVDAVGGDHIEAFVITEEGADGLAKADFVYETGLDAEPWLNEAVLAVNPGVERYILTDGMPTLQQGAAFWTQMKPPHPDADRLPPCCRKDAADSNAAWSELVKSVPMPSDSGKAGIAAGVIDQNVWFSVPNAMTAVVSINETLAEVDPDNADAYDRNTVVYLDKLTDLDGWIKSEVREIPAGKRMLVSDGNRFRYFAQAYGLVAPVNFPSYEGLVFVETTNPGAGEKPAEAYTLMLPGKFSGSYADLMRGNTLIIAEELEKTK